MAFAANVGDSADGSSAVVRRSEANISGIHGLVNNGRSHNPMSSLLPDGRQRPFLAKEGYIGHQLKGTLSLKAVGRLYGCAGRYGGSSIIVVFLD